MDIDGAAVENSRAVGQGFGFIRACLHSRRLLLCHYRCVVCFCSAVVVDCGVVLVCSGFDLFAGQFPFSNDKKAEHEFAGLAHRSNFDTIGYSIVTAFQLSTPENWNGVLYDAISAQGWAVGALYMIITVLMLHYVVEAVFIAILLSNFDTPSQDYPVCFLLGLLARLAACCSLYLADGCLGGCCRVWVR